MAKSGEDDFDDKDSLFDDDADASASISGGSMGIVKASSAKKASSTDKQAPAQYNEADVDALISDSDDEDEKPRPRAASSTPSAFAARAPLSAPVATAQDLSGFSSGFSSAEIDNSPPSKDISGLSVSHSRELSRPASRQRRLPPAAGGDDDLFSDDDASIVSGADGGLGPEPSLAGLKTPAAAAPLPLRDPGALTSRSSVSTAPEPLPSDSVDFSTRASGRGAASPTPPADNYTKGVAVDLGSSGVSVASVMLPEHLKKQEAKRLALLNPGTSGAGTKPNAMASAAAKVDAAGLGFADKRTGFDLPSPLQLFRVYDVDMGGAINRAEFGRMLYELDGLGEAPPNQEPEAFKRKRDKYVAEQFDKWDLNHDDMISIDEFYLYFYSELCFKFPLLRTGVNPGADLFNIFVKYCSFGKAARLEEMSSHQFSKMSRDCKLINGKAVTHAVIDIIYYRSKAELGELESFKKKHGEYITNKMLYPQFLFGLMYIANKRKSGFQEVVSRILENVSALPPPSMADLIIFRSNGSEQQKEEYLERPRGLPRPPVVISDTSERLRKEAEMAKSYGLPCSKKHLHGPGGGMQGTCTEQHVHEDGDDDNYTSHGGSAEFEHGHGSIPGQSGLSSSSLPTPKGGGVMGVARIEKRFMDDKESLPDFADMTAVASQDKLRKWGLHGAGEVTLPKSGQQGLLHPESMMAVRDMNPDTLLMALKRVFEMYNLWESGLNKGAMDKIRFHKMMRDTRMVSEGQIGGLNSAMVDKIFYKVLPPAKSSLNFVQFVETLRHVAIVLRITLNEVMEKMVIVQGPVNNKSFN